MKDKKIHYEVTANQIVGILVGFIITRYLTIPLLAYFDPDWVAVFITFVFTAFSYIRTYGIRWIFKHKFNEK